MSTPRQPQRGNLLLSEVFGPTIQGEGPSTGRTAAFLRLGGCNLTCRWCDTPYTWDSTSYNLDRELQQVPTSEVTEQLHRIGVPLVVVTGGEPLLQSTELAVLARGLRQLDHRLELETNGTIPLATALRDAFDLLVVSPKLANSELAVRARLRMPVLRGLADLDESVFKFVVESPDDLDEVQRLADELDLPAGKVWIMPQATDPALLASRLAEVAPAVYRRGWSLSGRMHILMWGDQRGR